MELMVRGCRQVAPFRGLGGLLVCWLLLAGCVGRAVEVPSVAPQRVVLAVLAGDNSLSGEVAWRMDALREGWEPQRMGPLFVLADSGDREVPILYRLVCDGGKRWIVEQRMAYLENSASEELWRATFDYLLRRIHPQARVGLVVFSHGSGWLPEGTLARPRSFVEDQRREMSLEGLARVLPKDRLDYVLFDMCLTAGVEVAYALREKVPYLVVSSAEMLSPGFVPLYRSQLALLYGPQPEGLIAWSKAYAAEVEAKEGIYRSGTLSVLSLSPMDRLAEWVRQYDKGVRSEAIEHYDRTAGDPLFYDLGGYLTQQGGDQERLGGLLRELVLYKWHTPIFMGRAIKAHSGLTLYLPSDRYPYLNRRYRETAWWLATKGGA